MQKAIFILIVSILIFQIVSSNEQEIISKEYRGPPKRDIILAASLSLAIPGAGQIYAGQKVKGILLFLTEGTIFVSGLGFISDYSYDFGNGFLVNEKEFISQQDRNLAIACGITLLGLHIYNIVDAIKLSMKFNERIDEYTQKNNLVYRYIEKKDPFIAALLSWKMPGLGQIYTKKYFKGSKFITCALALKSLEFYMNYDFENRYGEKPFGISFDDLSEKDKQSVIAYGIIYLSFRIYAIIDAYKEALKYNKKYEKEDSIIWGLSLLKNKALLSLEFKF